MRASRFMAAALGAFAVFGGMTAAAQVAYVPPNAPKPRFGGVFRLSDPGPVAGFWPTECRVWDIQTRQNESGPEAVDPTKTMLNGFISGLIAMNPTYGDFSPGMAEEVRRNLPTYWPTFNHMGGFSVAKLIGQDSGNKVYVVDQAGGETHWYVMVNPGGKIERAFLCAGQGA